MWDRALVVCAGLVACAGCHVQHAFESTRPGSRQHQVVRDRAQPRAATLVVTPEARFQLVEPLVCPSEDRTVMREQTELRQDPNLATFVVGVVLTAAGGIVTANGALGHETGLTLGGVAGLVVGLPLAVGPWIPRRSTPGEERLRDVITPGPLESCGARPLAGAAGVATLAIAGVGEVFAALDADGALDVSPFALFDAFELGRIHGAAVHARLADGREIDALVDGATLAQARPAFLAHADFDAQLAPLRLVPQLRAETPRITLIRAAGRDGLRVVLVVRNAGPGDAYQLRGEIVASAAPSIDGRMIYVGHLARDQTATRELVIPLSPEAAASLRGADLDLAIELRDAHGTAPAEPVRYRGPLLPDPSR